MNLRIFLKNNQSARKIFGKREIVIVQKQLSGVNLTQSEKNRLSRDIRPKLRFINEIIDFRAHFDLKKGAENNEIIEKTKEVILEDNLAQKIKKIFLFGSIITNQMSMRSDIDVAVLFDKINLKEATRFRIRVAGRVSNKLDIQVFNILPEKIKREILKKHKVLYER